MKRITIKAITSDAINKESFEWLVKGAGEIESYEEKDLPKDVDIIAEHSFDTLMEGGLEFANGIWMAIKGFFKLSKFAVITIVSGLVWLYKKGAGSKDEAAKAKANPKVKK